MKIVINNTDGHYEMNGVEIDVGRQIVIRIPGGNHNTQHQSNNHKPKDAIHKTDRTTDEFRDPNNSSLLSSIVKIKDKFGRK